MAFQNINVGTAPNSGDGEPLRSALQKVNQNFASVTVELSDKSDVGHTHSVSDIAGLNLGAFATAQQGTTADTALQPGDDAALLGSSTSNAAGYVLTADGNGAASWEAPTGSNTPGAVAFTELTDVPQAYTGYQGMVLSVNNAEDGLVFAPAAPAGAPGAPGKEIELRANPTHVQWKYDSDAVWTNLIPLEDLEGPQGEQGEPGTGISILGGVDDVGDLPSAGNTVGDAYLVSGNFYMWTGSAWEDLGSMQGPAGPAGKDVELRQDSGYIQWRVVGGTWANLVELSALRGNDGAPGAAGASGTNGKEVELRVSSGNIQWRLTGGTWANLVSLQDLTGPAGQPGSQGAPGTNGREVGLRVDAGYVQWRLGTDAWGNLVPLDDLRGPQGNTGSTGAGVAAGGTSGQILMKSSGVDYATHWDNLPVPSLSTLSDTSVSVSPSSGDIISWDGTSWRNTTLASAGIAPSSHDHDSRYYTKAQIDSGWTTSISAMGWRAVTFSDGTQDSTGQLISETATASSIAYRGADGVLAVGTPVLNSHAATKLYVDTGLSGKANSAHSHSADDITSGTIGFSRLPTGTGASQVAVGNHSHSTSAITSGTLGIARGGTGLSSYTAGSYLYASSSSVLAQRTPAQVKSDIGFEPFYVNPPEDGEYEIVFDESITLNLGAVRRRGGGDLAYSRSTNGTTFTSVSGSTSFSAGDVLRITVTNYDGYLTLTIPRTA